MIGRRGFITGLVALERLKQVLDYDPATGEFRWKIRLGGKAVVGRVAGSIDHNGYRVIRIDRRIYQAHRLAWFYVYGVWPAEWLDHKDRVKHHNAIDNLREATCSQNGANKLAYRTNTSGFKGVWWCRGKWMAQIQVSNDVIYLGRFTDPVEASAAYEAAAFEHFGEFAPQ